MLIHRDVNWDGRITDWKTEGNTLVVKGRNPHLMGAIDHYQRLRNNPEYSRQGIRKDWHHVASVPADVQLEWATKFGFEAWNAHPNEIARFIETHPEYNKLKVTDGRIA